MSALLDWFERNKIGIIGSLAMHSFLLFAFSLWQISTAPPEGESSEMRMDVISNEEAEQLIQRIEHPELAANTAVTNLTSNITAQQVVPSYSPTRLAERVENELRDMEQQEFDRLAEERRERGEEVTIPQLDPSKWNKELYMEKAAEPVKVAGATTVWHDLKGRIREEDVPGYLCKEQGRVAISVTVDRSGRVLKAELDAGRSAGADECMLEHALASAKRARFNNLGSAPDPQKGTLYFLFLPQ
ncbi:MAG: energy transducer TonB [Flavobacteriales bacterium]